MLAEVEIALHADEQRAVRCGRIVPGARARAANLDIGERALDDDFASDRLGERAATGVASADEQNAHATHASPMRPGTLSRSTRAGIAPGRMTRGARPMQSTTVDGSEGVSRPPSRTRRSPRAMASGHCVRISCDVIAGGTPGRLALVEVIGSPCARISRCMAG